LIANLNAIVRNCLKNFGTAIVKIVRGSSDDQVTYISALIYICNDSCFSCFIHCFTQPIYMIMHLAAYLLRTNNMKKVVIKRKM